MTSALYASLGYEAVMINRIGTTLKTNLEKEGGLEFIWEAHPYTGKGERDNAIFTHVLAETYLTPNGFHPIASSPCFRRDFPDDCINLLWAKRIHPQFGRQQGPEYVVAIIMGHDFDYQDRRNWSVLKKLIEKLNKRASQLYNIEVQAKFSTFERYLDEKMQKTNITYPVYKNDFVPYIQLESGTYDHWTGFYSNKPVLK